MEKSIAQRISDAHRARLGSTKFCTKCDTEYPLDEVNFRKQVPQKSQLVEYVWSTYCRTCQNKYDLERNTRCLLAQSPEKKAEARKKKKQYDRFRTHRLEHETAVQMERDSGGVCQICRLPRALVIDHNHGTGAIRGLLCTPCNAGIGMLGDDVKNLQAAIDYLQSGQSYPTAPEGAQFRFDPDLLGWVTTPKHVRPPRLCIICGEQSLSSRAKTCGRAECLSTNLISERTIPSPCVQCTYVAKSKAGLRSHTRNKHRDL
jgi:Recombination endonuclease VII